jgi:ABC-2 type transport system permease protein
MTALTQIRRAQQHRNILTTLVRRDLRIRYARSVLGYLWTLIDPLAMALVFYMVFAVFFQRHEAMGLPFIVFMLCGLLPWNWFNNTINETARAIYADRQLVRSTNIPRELWVIRVVIAKGIEHLLSLPILLGFVVIYVVLGKVHPNWEMVWILPALVVEFVLLIGLGLIMAPVTALVDDFVRIVRIALRVGFYFSPIVYELALVKNRFPAISTLLQLNPITGIAEMYRIGLTDVPPTWGAITMAFVLAVLWLFVGLWVFRRLERAVLKEI